MDIVLNFISNVLIIFSSLFDIVFFKKITQVRLDLKHKGIILLIVLLIGEVINESVPGELSVFLADIFVTLGLLFLYRTEMNIVLLLGSLIVIYYFDVLVDVTYSVIIGTSNSVYIRSLSIILLVGLEFCIIFKYSSFFRKQLTGQNNRIFIWLISYLYIIEIAVGIIFGISKNIPPVSRFLSLTLIVQAIFAIGMYYELLRIQKTILKRHQQEELQKDLEQQKNYTETLEKDEDNLRRFRHDYKNILTAIKYSIQNGDYEKAVAELDKYTEENLDNDALLKYKDVNHVKIDYVKSLLVAKISKMANEDINYDFECREDIDELPTGINELDLIRIMGIVIDNAIEESQKIILETKDNSQAEIQMMMYSSEDTGFEFEIRNKIKDSSINPSQMKKAGYSTKENHAGLGLANIDQIGQKYPAMDISYEVIDGYFDFYLVVEGDE